MRGSGFYWHLVSFFSMQKAKADRTFRKFHNQISCIVASIMILTIPSTTVFAVDTTANGASATNLVGWIVNIVVSLFFYVGLVLLVWGIAQFVLALKRTDAESKSDAIQTIIAAIVLMALRTIIKALNLPVSVGNDSVFIPGNSRPISGNL